MKASTANKWNKYSSMIGLLPFLRVCNEGLRRRSNSLIHIVPILPPRGIYEMPPFSCLSIYIEHATHLTTSPVSNSAMG